MILTMNKLQSVHERNAREVQTQRDNAIAVQNHTVTDTYTIGLVAAVKIGTNASYEMWRLLGAVEAISSQQILAFAMGLHGRLGRASKLQCLKHNHDVLQSIYQWCNDLCLFSVVLDPNDSGPVITTLTKIKDDYVSIENDSPIKMMADVRFALGLDNCIETMADNSTKITILHDIHLRPMYWNITPCDGLNDTMQYINDDIEEMVKIEHTQNDFALDLNCELQSKPMVTPKVAFHLYQIHVRNMHKQLMAIKQSRLQCHMKPGKTGHVALTRKHQLTTPCSRCKVLADLGMTCKICRNMTLKAPALSVSHIYVPFL
jgi:hypothetical protein